MALLTVYGLKLQKIQVIPKTIIDWCLHDSLALKLAYVKLLTKLDNPSFANESYVQQKTEIIMYLAVK